MTKNSFPSCVLHFKKPDNHAPQRHRIHLCRGSLAEAEAATPTQSVLAEWLFASSSPSSSSTTTTTPTHISVPLSFASSPTQESCFFFRRQRRAFVSVTIRARHRSSWRRIPWLLFSHRKVWSRFVLEWKLPRCPADVHAFKRVRVRSRGRS